MLLRTAMNGVQRHYCVVCFNGMALDADPCIEVVNCDVNHCLKIHKHYRHEIILRLAAADAAPQLNALFQVVTNGPGNAFLITSIIT